MKKAIRLFVFIITLSLLVCFESFSVSATQDTPTDYDALFMRANEVDGYFAESYSIELADTFDQNPNDFIRALSFESSTTINNTTLLLVTEYQTRDTATIKATLIDLLDTPTTSEAESYVISVILGKLDSLGSSHIDSPLINYEFPDRTFNKDFVRKIIDTNLEIGVPANGEFYSYVSKIYQANPTLFADMISDMPSNSVEFLGECIAADMLKNNITPPTVENISATTTLNILNKKIINSIQTANLLPAKKTSETTNTSYDTMSYTGAIPTILGFTYSYQHRVPFIGDEVEITVTLGDTSGIGYLQTYYVILYQVIEHDFIELGRNYVYIAPGTVQGSASFSAVFNEIGSKSLYVYVLDASKTYRIISGGSTTPLLVAGQWSIAVDLPEDRWTLGYMTLFDSYGLSECSDICLGGSWLNNGNNDPSEYKGNTPTGVYSGYLDGPFLTEKNSYGIHQVIRLTGISGEIMECTARSGLLIHGGRDGEASPNASYYPLWPTNGCIRVTSDFQKILQDTITQWINEGFCLNNEGIITVTEYEAVSIPS